MPHTPGPWEVRNPPAPGHMLAVIAPQYRKECDASHVVCELRPWQKPDPDPNARLIAAAPELLECCYRLLQIVEVEYEADPEPEDLDAWREAIQLAAACIAKAEGRGE